MFLHVFSDLIKVTIIMEDLEVATQKYVANFCKILPSHLEAWKSLQENASKPLHSLVNFSEQLNHIEK